MKTVKQLPVQIILSLVMMFFIISLSVMVTLHFRQIYYHDIDALDIPERSGYSAEVCRRNYDALIDYNTFFGPDKLEFPDLAMSETGRIHFEEVKRILLFFEGAALVCGALTAAGIVYMCRKKQIFYLLLTGIITVAVPLILGIYMYFNWDRAFVQFHSLFFNNDYWIFSEDTDPVIKILPDTFFEHCAFSIIGCVLLFSIICIIVYYVLRRRAGRTAAPDIKEEHVGNVI